MYYKESSNLITDNPTNTGTIRALDRLLAHAYSRDQHGFVELGLLCYKTKSTCDNVKWLMGLYENTSIVRRYEKVICECGHKFDPDDEACSECESSAANASQTDDICYAILKAPIKPAYDPELQSKTPDVFISYRHDECSILATDIFIVLQEQGKSVFLDEGYLAPGANAERDFLDAASHAGHFICLVSQHYFDSPYCKREIAHAVRCGQRMLRVNVPPVPSAPGDMPWIDGPNWIRVKGSEEGLEVELEEALLNALKTPTSGGADLRQEACQYLMTLMSPHELLALWNKLPWMNNYSPANLKDENIRVILQEATPQRLPVLCNALAP